MHDFQIELVEASRDETAKMFSAFKDDLIKIKSENCERQKSREIDKLIRKMNSSIEILSSSR